MKNLHLIKEGFVHLTDSPEFRNMVLMSTMLWEGESEFEFIESWPDCYVSYLNQDQKRLIHFWLFHDQEEVEPDRKDHLDRNFVGLLKEQNPVSFPDLVYISTLYDPFHFYDSTNRIPPFGPRLIVGDFLDQMFLESRGRIVYHFQLEMLYLILTECSVQQAIKFRQGIGKKDAWAWMEAELLKFPGGKTLKNVMDERMINEFTLSPNYRGAMNLYECCYG